MNSKRLGKLEIAAALSVLVQSAILAGPLDAWHQRNSSSETNALFSVVYGNGLFVAAGQGGTILTSTDGIAWAHQESGTNANLGPIVSGSGMFLARASGGSGNALLKSNDGTNWISLDWEAGFPWWDKGHPINGLDFVNGRFFLLSFDFFTDGSRRSVIFASSGATNWTRLRTAEIGYTFSAAYGNGLYVAVGSTPGMLPGLANSIPLILTSPDTITWNALSFDSFQYWNKSFGDVVFGKDTFVAVGDGSVLSSPDGTNWTRRLAGPPVSCIAFGDGIFVAVGSMGSLATSTDGLNWTVRDPGTKYWLDGVTYGQNTFVAVGYNGLIIQSDPIVTLGFSRGVNTGFSLTGPPGRTYEIHAVDQLLATNNWQTLGTVTLTNTAVSWVDLASTNKLQRFYRAVLAP